MKKISIVLYFLGVLIASVYSQTLSEKDIKLSGKYYYGEAVSTTESISTQTSKEELMACIAREYKMDIQGDILANGIKYLSFPRGNKIRTIAFILKTDVLNFEKKQNNLVINEIKSSDSPKLNSDTSLTKITIQQTNNNKVNENNIDAPPTNKLITDLVSIQNGNDLLLKLNDLKKKGKITYGQESKFTIKEKCYIFILNKDEKLEAILGTGDLTRYDYKSNQFINNYKETFKNNIEIWLFIYE